MSCVSRQLSLDRVAEVRDQRRRFLVAVGFGQGSEAGNIGKEEGGSRAGESDASVPHALTRRR